MKNKTLMTFCLKIVILIIALFGVDRLIDVFFIKTKDVGLEQNPYHHYTKTAFILEKCDADCIIIGSSKAEHSYVTGILADSLGYSIYNGGQGGCFFLYQNYIINMLLDRRIPKKIIWDIQPECIPASSKMKEYQNNRYFSPYYDSDKWVREYIDSENERANIKMQCRMFRYNSKIIQYVIPLITDKVNYDGGYKSLPNSGYHHPKKKTNVSFAESEVKYDEYKLGVYKETLNNCKKNNVDLTIFVSPTYVQPSFTYKKSIELLSKITQNYGYKLFDYSVDEHFVSDSTLFKDVSHLNDNGARLYTQQILNVIKKDE